MKSNQKQLEENLVYINYLKSDISDLINDSFEKQKLSTKCEISVVEFLLQLEEFKQIYKLYNRGITFSRVKHMLDSMKIIKSFSVSKLLIYFEQLEETLNKLYQSLLRGSSLKNLETLLSQNIENCKNIQFERTIFIY